MLGAALQAQSPDHDGAYPTLPCQLTEAYIQAVQPSDADGIVQLAQTFNKPALIVRSVDASAFRPCPAGLVQQPEPQDMAQQAESAGVMQQPELDPRLESGTSVPAAAAPAVTQAHDCLQAGMEDIAPTEIQIVVADTLQLPLSPQLSPAQDTQLADAPVSVTEKAPAANVVAQEAAAAADMQEAVTAQAIDLHAAEADLPAATARSSTQDLHLQLTYLESQAIEQPAQPSVGLPPQAAAQQSRHAQQDAEVPQPAAQQAQHTQQAQHAQQKAGVPQPAAQHAQQGAGKPQPAAQQAQHAQQMTGVPQPAAQQAQHDQQGAGPDDTQPAAAFGASPAKLSLNLDTQLPEEAAPNVRATPGKGLQKSPQPGRQSWWNQPWSVAQLSEESQTLPTGLSHVQCLVRLQHPQIMS